MILILKGELVNKLPVKQLIRSFLRSPKSLQNAAGVHRSILSLSPTFDTRTGWPLLHCF